VFCRSTMLLALCLSLPFLNGAEPPYWGTIFVSSEIVTAGDPSCFESIEERGTGMRTMYDRRIPGWTRQQALQSLAEGGLTSFLVSSFIFGR